MMNRVGEKIAAAVVITLAALGVLLIAFIVIYKISPPKTGVRSSVSSVRSYERIEELKKEAEHIVEAEVNKSTVTSVKGVDFTLSDAVVRRNWKGTLKSGDPIVIIQTGARTGDHQDSVYRETDILSEHQRALVFLRHYSGPVHEDAYVILGEYHGKFLIDQDGGLIPSEGVAAELGAVRSIEDLEL